MGPAVCYVPGTISMKEDWVQGAPLNLHTQLHMHFVPHALAAGKDCPLQLSFHLVYCYPLPWYGVQNTPMGQRVNNVCLWYFFYKTIKLLLNYLFWTGFLQSELESNATGVYTLKGQSHDNFDVVFFTSNSSCCIY